MVAGLGPREGIAIAGTFRKARRHYDVAVSRLPAYTPKGTLPAKKPATRTDRRVLHQPETERLREGIHERRRGFDR